MSDLSDVETAIVNLITGLVYPNGSGAPSAVLNDALAPMPVRIYRGWPISANLDADLAAGTMNISVYSRNGTEKNTTRFHPDFQTVTTETATVAASVNASNQVVITGNGAVGITQWVTVLVGFRVAVAYNVLAADTPTTIASGLAGQLTAAGVPATSSLGVVSLTAQAAYVSAMVGVTGTQAAEWRRQETQIQITLWCPTPTTRDNAAKLVEPTLAQTTFLTLPDQFQARFRYHNTLMFDGAEKVQLYRRDLIYSAEYATTVTDTASEVTAVNTNIAGSVAPLGSAPVIAIYAPTPAQPNPAPNLWPGPPYQPLPAAPLVPGPPLPVQTAPTPTLWPVPHQPPATEPAPDLWPGPSR